MKIRSLNLRFLMLFFLLIAAVNVFSQNLIKGKTLDVNNQPLAGVNVYLKGTYIGTSSNEKGVFAIDTKLTGQQTIVARMIGFKEKEVQITLSGSETELTIVLEDGEMSLQKVEIVAGTFEAGDKIKSEILQPMDIALTASSSADIYGALSTFPGTQMVGEEGKLFVRGGESYETKTFIDGLQVESPYSNEMPDMPARGKFSPLIFSGTMFNTGGYSAEYGQALSSSLILSTKDMPASNLTNINLYSIGLGLSHTQVTNKSALILSYDYSNLSPYYSIVKQNIDWIKAPVSNFGTINYFHKIREHGLLKTLFSYSDDRSNFYYPYYGQNKPYVGLDLKNISYTIFNSYKEPLSEKTFIKVGIGFSNDINRIALDNIDLKDRIILGQIKLSMTHELSNSFKILYGTDIFYKDFVENVNRDNLNAVFNYINHQYSLYAETEVKISNSLAFRVGGRAEYSSVINSASVVPRISCAYKFESFGQISLAYGTFYQDPESKYLKFTRELKPEYADHFIFNYQYEYNKRVFRLETYYKKYHDLVKYLVENDPDPDSYNNAGKGFAKGFDLFFRDRVSIPHGDYWISYSYLDSKRDYRNYPIMATPKYFSKHNFSFVYKHWISAIKSNIGLTYRYSSGRPFYNPNLPSEKFMSEKTKPYNDLSGNYAFDLSSFTKIPVTFFFSVNNIMGDDHIYGYNYSTTPDSNGKYTLYPVRSLSTRFYTMAILMSF